MTKGNLDEMLRANDRVLKLLWIGMSGALVVYAGLPFIVSTSVEPAVSIVALGGLAAAVAVAAVVYRRSRFADASLVKLLAREVPSGDAIAGGLPDGAMRAALLEKYAGMGADKRRVYHAVAALQAPYIVVWALNESIGIFGLVGAFMGHDATVVLPFVGAAMALQISSFPRVAELADRLQKLALTTPGLGGA